MLKLKNISKSYNNIQIFDDLNCEFEKNKFTVILGPSGSGKTTILNMISGLDKEFFGTVEGVPEKISYVFQEDRLLDWKTVEGNMHFIMNSMDTISSNKMEDILKIMELSDKRRTTVRNLSGGERRRVSIARAFLYPGEVILLDEALKGLDIVLKQSIVKKILEIFNLEKKTIISVSHDVDEALLMADRVYVISKPPSRIVKQIDIDIEKYKRELRDEKLLKYEVMIYDALFSKD